MEIKVRCDVTNETQHFMQLSDQNDCESKA